MLVACFLASLLVVTLVLWRPWSRDESTPEQTLTAFFESINAGDRSRASGLIQVGERGMDQFLDRHFAAAPYAALSYQVSYPFGPGTAAVSVKGLAAGKPYAEVIRLSDPTGKYQIFLGTRSAG